MDVLTIYNNAPKPYELMKSMQNVELHKNKIIKPKSAIIDPTNSLNYMGTRDRPSSVPIETLRRLSHVPAISAVINTRLSQMSRFTRRPRFEGDMGFRVTTKDSKKRMTEAEANYAKDLEDCFMKTGMVPNRQRRDNFNHFLRKIARDTLVLDVMTWENVFNKKDKLSEIWAIDAGTISLVADSPVSAEYMNPVYEPMTRDGRRHRGDIAYIQTVNGIVLAEYEADELAFAIRNPQTDVNIAPWGHSELEDLVEIVTAIVNGVKYNTSYFSQSSLPQGILEIVGKYEDEHLEAFQRFWKTMTSGANGKWSVPVFAMEEGQGFKWTDFKQNNRDMEYTQFMEFLFNIACAVMQIDPNEVGFKSWTSQSNSMGSSDNTKEKISQSQDKGFVPLMNFMADTFNIEIIDRIEEDFVFEWLGVDSDDEDAKLERDTKLIKAGIKVVNEVRKERDIDPIEDLWANAPADPTLIQVFTATNPDMLKAQQQAQAQQQEQQQQAQGQEQEAGQGQADDAHKKQLEIGQAQADQGQGQADDAHKKQLEIMDKTHQQTMQQMQATHAHELKLASTKTPPKPVAKTNKIKKSFKLDDLAEVAHEAWRRYASGSDNPNNVDYINLPSDQKELSRQVVTTILDSDFSGVDLDNLQEMDNQGVEYLAERVHNTWEKHAKKGDPDIKPYDSLHEAVKETDREIVRAVLDRLAGTKPDDPEALVKGITPDFVEIELSWEKY